MSTQPTAPVVTSSFHEPGARKRSSYLPQLDGLRGIAILSVLLHHFGVHLPGWLDWGPTGVRIFFLLSGYLITLSLWKLESPGPGGYWYGLFSFHRRRMVRLTPSLYFMLLIAAIFSVEGYREALHWHAAFLSNFYVLKMDYWPGAASHLWSLSVQEQFYLLWPFLLLIVPRKYLPWALLALMAGAFVYRFTFMKIEASVFYRWVMLPSVIDSFALGALIACWKRANKPFPLAEGRTGLWIGIAAGACYIVARTLRMALFVSPWFSVIDTFENVFLGWLMLRTIVGWKGWLGRFFENPVLVYIGKVSYGLYVFHVLVHVFVGPLLNQMGLTMEAYAFPRSLILIAISVGVAAISYHYVEAPLATWVRRRYDAAPPRREVAPAREGGQATA